MLEKNEINENKISHYQYLVLKAGWPKEKVFLAYELMIIIEQHLCNACV